MQIYLDGIEATPQEQFKIKRFIIEAPAKLVAQPELTAIVPIKAKKKV